MSLVDLAKQRAAAGGDDAPATGRGGLVALAHKRVEQGAKNGAAVLGGYPVIGIDSNASIHDGSHIGGGVFDVTERAARQAGKTLEEVAQDLAAQGFIAAVRTKGQRKIKSNHVHAADPNVNPREAARLEKQRVSGNKSVYSWVNAIKDNDDAELGTLVDAATARQQNTSIAPTRKPNAAKSARKQKQWTQPLAEQAIADRTAQEQVNAMRIAAEQEAIRNYAQGYSDEEALLAEPSGRDVMVQGLLGLIPGAGAVINKVLPGVEKAAIPAVAKGAAKLGVRAGLGAAEGLAQNAVTTLPELIQNPAQWLEMQRQGAPMAIGMGVAGQAVLNPLLMGMGQKRMPAAVPQEIAPQRPARPFAQEPDYVGDMVKTGRNLDRAAAETADNANLDAFLMDMDRQLGPQVESSGLAGRAPGMGRDVAPQVVPDVVPARLPGPGANGVDISEGLQGIPRAPRMPAAKKSAVAQKQPSVEAEAASGVEARGGEVARDSSANWQTGANRDAVIGALRDWKSNRLYVDNNGNYRKRPSAGKKGAIHPFNKILKQTFASVDDLHAAAEVEFPDTTSKPASLPQEPTSTPSVMKIPVEALRDRNVVDVVRDDIDIMNHPAEARRGFRSLRNSIRDEGQKTPIELYIKADGTIDIVEGTHRIKAIYDLKELGKPNFDTVNAVIAGGDPKAIAAFRAKYPQVKQEPAATPVPDSTPVARGGEGETKASQWPPRVGQEVSVPHQNKIGTVVAVNDGKYTIKLPTQKGPRNYTYDVALLREYKPVANNKKSVESSGGAAKAKADERDAADRGKRLEPITTVTVKRNAFDGNVIQPGRFIGSTKLVFDSDIVTKRPAWTSKPDPLRSNAYPQDKIASYFKKTVADADVALEEHGRVDGTSYFSGKDGAMRALPEDQHRLVHSLGYDSVRSGSSPESPLVFYKGKKPVAIVPPYRPDAVPKIKLSAKLTPAPSQPLTELNAGPNIASAVRQADNLNIGPNPREMQGTFTVNRPETAGNDYRTRNMFQQPLGIYNPDGSIIQKGAYDRVGTVLNPDGTVDNLGSKVGYTIRQAERATTEGMLKANQTIDHIGELIESAMPRKTLNPIANKRLREKAFARFVDLVEKPIDDPARVAAKSSDTPTGQALRLHDEMTDNFRDYIINSRRELGIETPDDWGITDKGYFRHLFLGDIKVMRDGNFIGTARTYAEAQKMAIDILNESPQANITAQARNTFFGDPTVRVSTKKFFKVVGDIAEQTDLTKADIMEDLRGVVGRKSAKTKQFGALLQRKGAEGYSKAYSDVMRIHAAQMYRTQELSKLNKAIMPMVEKLRSNGKPGLAQAMEDHLSDLWGTPQKWEVAFGREIESIPILRNHVAIPSMAFRGLAAKLTRLQTALKLQGSPRSAAVNLIQPFSTLWPYVETKQFVGLYKDFLKPSTRRMLRERGVLAGTTKLESGGSAVLQRNASSLNPLNWFQKASEVNRGIGYLFGYKRGLKQGMSTDAAHQLGLSWAEKVEFDNSTWNVQPILRSPQARVLGQFKSFMGKNMENVRDVLKPEDLPTAQRVGRAAKWATAQLGVGGVKSLGYAGEILGGYVIVQQVSKQLQANGVSKEDANRYAKAVYYGAPALLGQDLSASVAILEPPYGRTLEEKAVNFLFGPTVGTAFELKKAYDKGDPVKALKAISGPAYKVYDVATQAASKGLGNTTVKTGNKRYEKLTEFEAVMRGLGFTPVKQSEAYDKPKQKKQAPGFAPPKFRNPSLKQLMR